MAKIGARGPNNLGGLPQLRTGSRCACSQDLETLYYGNKVPSLHRSQELKIHLH
jgi:hypothetical protein